MKVLVGVTGSVATVLLPKFIELLLNAGHEVQVVATRSSLYFFDQTQITVRVWQDKDEWFGERYVRSQSIPHIELRRWADVFVIAPLGANTLAKLANGLCDNLLTNVFRAWDFGKPLVIAPAMNTLMWESPFTRLHLASLEQLKEHGLRLTVVDPIKKTLACADTGIGAMASLEEIVRALEPLS